MTEQDKLYFEKLVQDRKESAAMLDKPSMRGVKKSVVEKYSDQAHFIYELIQNADDAGATEAHFELYKKELIFRHNGTRHFFVSNPETEEQDTKRGCLGDINAITSIANSNKTDSAATIGKFGVGFKAVFQYTMTPHIYDSNAAFKIEHFIVPVLLEKDYKSRKEEETIFVFPFDHPKNDAEKAYQDIQEKLQNLVFPILFLKNLHLITYWTISKSGKYTKEFLQNEVFDNTTEADLIKVKNGIGEEANRLWVFSRTIAHNLKYSVGFFLDKKGELTPVDYSAFCFFPTKTATGLKFIIDAPFLLTDSREGIKAAEPHNIKMVEMLAELAADSLSYLKDLGEKTGKRLLDDSISGIIPTNPNIFSSENNGDMISFLPIYNKIRKKMKGGLLPTRDGYTKGESAYWSDTLEINDLFSDTQLTDLFGKESHWVFVTLARDWIRHREIELRNYIDGIVSGTINETQLFQNITADFIEQQSEEWLLQLYHYILDKPSRFDYAKKLPIFLDEDKKAVSLFDKAGHENLFLPDQGVTGFRTINAGLWKHEVVRKLLGELNISQPKRQDIIYKIILPLYEENTEQALDYRYHFRVFLDYYIECEESGKTQNKEAFLHDIRKYGFLAAHSAASEDVVMASPNQIYMPLPELRQYFSHNKTILFFEHNFYLFYKKDEFYLDRFLKELGVHDAVDREIIDLSQEEATKYFGYKWPDYARNRIAERSWKEYRFKDGEIVVKEIEECHSEQLSVLLWNQLCKLFERTKGKVDDPILGLAHSYPYRGTNWKLYEGRDAALFSSSKWLINKAGVFVAPQDISVQDLPSDYLMNTGASELSVFLRFGQRSAAYENLSEDQRKKVKLADLLEKYGISDIDEEEIARFSAFIKKNRQPVISGMEEVAITKEESFMENGEVPSQTLSENEDISSLGKRILEKRRTANSIPDAGTDQESFQRKEDSLESEGVDSDEYSKAVVDYEKQLEKTRQKCEDEMAQIALLEELQEKVLNTSKYSYEWFCTILTLETMANSEQNNEAYSREVSISFGKVEKDPKSNRILILKYPNKHIPQVMEELADIPLILKYSDGTEKRLSIEVSQVQSYIVKVKLKMTEKVKEIDLEDVKEAHIEARRPAFLLEELQHRFQELAFEPAFDMKQNLCENIEFIFGPPGTGKTTYLAKNILLPLMTERESLRVLVLTPTNKASDVIVKRVMEIMGTNSGYEEWLIRYGITTDEGLEESPVYHSKEMDIRDYSRCVVSTTVIRFAYDYFIGRNNIWQNLRDINWDYIIVDEASMIPLVQIVYPLYYKKPRKFIIAGDPFQIEPVTSVDLWKNENIYTMVQLNSFASPSTVPHDYPVKLLTTQYRSIPEIGDVFSKLTYDGILEHYRKKAERRELHIEEYLKYDSLNIIKFPVSKYESIYRAKRLKTSSNYQAYSALFVFEFVQFLAEKLAQKNPGEKFRIGIIAPYNAQAGLIERLLDDAKKMGIFSHLIEIGCSTIHGFQGDECDIIITVFNPPPYISDNPEMFLNHQNIINVAISRARDYLFVLMPDDKTDRVNRLFLIKSLEHLIKRSGAYVETDSHTLEQAMMGTPNFLEDNSFSTGHQLVNVYGQPEKRYEIRSEDSAVDIQVHRENIALTKHETETIKPAKNESPSENKEEQAKINTNEIHPNKGQSMIPPSGGSQRIKPGAYVRHRLFGVGRIESIEERRIVVSFPGGKKVFEFPTAFKMGFLKLC